MSAEDKDKPHYATDFYNEGCLHVVSGAFYETKKCYTDNSPIMTMIHTIDTVVCFVMFEVFRLDFSGLSVFIVLEVGKKRPSRQND